MVQLIVERNFETPLTDDDLQALSQQLAPCITDYGGKWLGSCVSTDRTRSICAFDAPDAESVRMAHRTAKVRLDAIWPAEIFRPDDDSGTPAEDVEAAR